MAMEGPFVTAMISRLPDPKHNLAAFGVAFSIALFMEAPVIMMMSASVRLVFNRQSYDKLRRFTWGLIAFVTAQFLVAIIPGIYRGWSQGLLNLDPAILEQTYLAVVCLLPWPGAIGYRRFYQGILISQKQSRAVAMGTVVRLATVAAVCAAGLLGWFPPWHGAMVGVLALSAGVCVEALVARWLARRVLPQVMAQVSPHDKLLNYAGIWTFYYPLVLTGLISLCVQPIVTLAMGWAPSPLESLAVIPVVNAIVFFFRAVPLSYQDVMLSLLGPQREQWFPLRGFAQRLAMALTLVFGVLMFTPLLDKLLLGFYDLPPDLASFAVLPLRLMFLMPILGTLLAWERSVLIHQSRTKLLTLASLVEITAIIAILITLIAWGLTTGVVAAALALVGGRLTATLYLRPHVKTHAPGNS